MLIEDNERFPQVSRYASKIRLFVGTTSITQQKQNNLQITQMTAIQCRN